MARAIIWRKSTSFASAKKRTYKKTSKQSSSYSGLQLTKIVKD